MGYKRDDVMFYCGAIAAFATLFSGMLADTSFHGTAFAFGVIAVGSAFVSLLAYLNKH